MGYAIGEARRQLPALIKRVLRTREEIHVGDRGSDVVTLVATAVYEQTKALARQALALRAEPQASRARPFAALESALRAGHRAGASRDLECAVQPALHPRTRRYFLTFQSESRINERAQAALGTGAISRDPTPSPPIAARRPRRQMPAPRPR
jgi:hypothetical protein